MISDQASTPVGIVCPVCKTTSHVQGPPNLMFTNMYALNIIELSKKTMSGLYDFNLNF